MGKIKNLINTIFKKNKKLEIEHEELERKVIRLEKKRNSNNHNKELDTFEGHDYSDLITEFDNVPLVAKRVKSPSEGAIMVSNKVKPEHKYRKHHHNKKCHKNCKNHCKNKRHLRKV